jgi:hypothetical protein
MALFILIMTIIAVSINFIGLYKTAKGSLRPAYWLMIFGGIAFFTLNTVVTFKSPENIGLIFVNLLSIWTVIMGIKGLLRLNKEKT